ncbi:MAG TPA: hypothetical protein DCZ95_04615 [Verrucomicrobia bacterium]|nr:MAG: hypothetical protein A2X46_14525 [Lentisphaerae bacterium GWF2_57_35]HBA83360.1 hypothetical protein [Verrucomicrobiota bacterium]
MTASTLMFLVFSIAGGLALFIFGMNVMSDGLRLAAGSSLRAVLSKATRNRFSGIVMGSILGTLVQSSATTVMLVGFINAGLMTLAESVPPMLGANLGTTLSMQLVSFKLGDYCFLIISAGFILDMVSTNTKIKNIGRSLMGFGLIFLGMNTMSDAIKPHRELFAKILTSIQGNSLSGLIMGTLMATAITAIIQSSGAVVGMCFALFSAGVFTSVEQAYPIILGARIGTCATALLGSIGAITDARRSALSHLLYNILTTAAAIAMAPLLIRFAEWSSHDLIHQAANVNTAVAAIGAIPFLLFSPLYARFITLLTPSKIQQPQPSFLDKQLIDFPEKALYAAIMELQRVSRICARSLKLTLEVIFTKSRRDIKTIKVNENVVDEIKRSMKDYVSALTTRALSRRQAILIQNLNRCMADIERIGDHIDELCDITTRRHKNPNGRFSRDILQLLVDLYEGAAKVLHLVIESLDPEHSDFQALAQSILKARDEYTEKSLNAKSAMMDKVASHEVPAIIGVYFSEYTAALDRIVKHAKMIALTEKQPYFWIKRQKLQKMADEAPDIQLPPRVDAHDFLDQLHSENYL